MFKINESLYFKKKSNIPGLKYLPSFYNHEDNNKDCHTVPSDIWSKIDGNSDANLRSLKQIISNIHLKNIVEIGIYRDNRSFTNILLNNKSKDGIYCGIDIDDKSSLNDIENNIYTLQCNSWDQGIIRTYLSKIGIEEVSLLLIDGFHGIDNVINDWMYSDLVKVGGVVVLHDTNYHPSSLIVDAIDTEFYLIDKHCITNYDWGLTAAYKIKEYV